MLRWGVIGSGFAARKFVLGLRQSTVGAAALVVSRDERNARGFAKDFGVPEVAPDVESAVRSANVDAFYIATPPSEHRAQAVACLAHGKPALVEKPLATSHAEALAIVAEARGRRVFCMEGMWTRFLPAAERARALLAEGAVGEARSLNAGFGSSNPPELADNQFRPDLGGGALMHRGIYAIAFALDLLGPADLAAAAATIGATGVDEDCALVLRHRGGALSTLRASLRAPLANDLTVEGTHGLLRVCAPIYRPFRLEVAKTRPAPRAGRGRPLVESIREGGVAQRLQQAAAGFRRPRAISVPYAGNGYHYEADEVARCLGAALSESPRMPLDESLRIAALMDEARRAWVQR